MTSRDHVYIGFGSNMGDSEEAFRNALRRLAKHDRIRVLAESSLYRSEPVGFTNQAWFVNGVVQVSTSLSPRDLLEILLETESIFGRRREIRWGPRTMDLDLLFHGTTIVEDPDLVVPHPRAHERRFVLVPMAEVAPEFRHPILGRTMRELLAELSEDGQDVRFWKRL